MCFSLFRACAVSQGRFAGCFLAAPSIVQLRIDEEALCFVKGATIRPLDLRRPQGTPGHLSWIARSWPPDGVASREPVPLWRYLTALVRFFLAISEMCCSLVSHIARQPRRRLRRVALITRCEAQSPEELLHVRGSESQERDQGQGQSQTVSDQ